MGIITIGIGRKRKPEKKQSVSLHIQSKCGKIRTRKTPNTDTFHVVKFKT